MEKTQLTVIPQPVSFRPEEGFFQSQGLPVIKGDESFQNEIDVVTGQLHHDLERMGVTAGTGNPVFCKKETGPADRRLNCGWPLLLLAIPGFLGA